MKKKILSLLLTTAIAATLATGCGDSSEQPDTTSGNNSPEQTKDETEDSQSGSEDSGEATAIEGNLVIWEHEETFAEPLKAVVAAFNEKYPDVTVETDIKTSDQYYNLLQTAMQAGETPDLFWTHGLKTSHYESFIKAGYCMDLTNIVDFSLYDGTNAMKVITLDDGKVYSTPTAVTDGRCVYYNKDIFEELNLAVPTTFSEFEAVLTAIAETDYTPLAFAGSDAWAIIFQLEPVLNGMSLDYVQEYEQNGYVEVNDDRVVAAYDKMLEWADKGYYGNGYLGVDGSGAVLAFSTGQAAMLIQGTWNVATIEQNNPDLNYGAFQIPTEDGTRSMVSTSATGLCVSADTENPDAAIAFANFFASKEGQEIWVNTLNAVPCTTAIASNNDVINQMVDVDVMTESYYNILGELADENAEENPTVVWEQEQVKVFTKELSPQEFLDQLEALTITK